MRRTYRLTTRATLSLGWKTVRAAAQSVSRAGITFLRVALARGASVQEGSIGAAAVVSRSTTLGAGGENRLGTTMVRQVNTTDGAQHSGRTGAAFSNLTDKVFADGTVASFADGTVHQFAK